ncbi:(E3-independent) E2 ubiquitin-conjugating enzyme UBE2O [Engraulis encrasicolus]|uniref:(E3-independent) E2 ubiquitin-conjugating enzyme UBE2O n=1 Tax=Engraulis encrasicolus TaxID=184585 RepID=UPI002FD3CE54
MAEPVASEATDAASLSPTPALSPVASPGSEPPSMALSPSAGGSQRLLFTHDLVSARHPSKPSVRSVRFGLVVMIHGEDDFDSDSDIDADVAGDGGGKEGGGGGGIGGGNSDTENGAADSRTRPLGRGFVRVQWYPDGVKQDVHEAKVKLEDRSLVPRDFVRRLNSNDKQCGIVTNINIECAVKLVGTNCVLYPVSSRDLQHIWSFMYGDYIVYDFWLGKVFDVSNNIILKLSNGARCSMSEEDGSKLYDVCPHVSDSGLFFDESYGFYPGQVLIGPSKVFANVQWLYGVKPVLSKKTKFRVVVEEVQVVQLKVTWITKSYSPKGSDCSVFPPPSTITQENLSKVKRLSHYDHTQCQLGDRALYVFPSKEDATHITCEGPEGGAVHFDDPICRKLKRLFREEQGRKQTDGTDAHGHGHRQDKPETEGDSKEDRLDENNSTTATKCPNNNGHLEEDQRSDGLTTTDNKDAQSRCQNCHAELQSNPAPPSQNQNADSDAEMEMETEDTDDTSSITSSASSTASLRSAGHTPYPGRKKSIPLSIRNLKRTHKKKRTKFSREFKPGDRVAVEVVSTVTSADVMWKDGRLEMGVPSNDLLPIQHVDNHEFCPGDYVLDKRTSAPKDPELYGVIQSGDHRARTCVVKWVRLNEAGDDIEVIGEEEDVSVYDIADHPDFHYRTTDVVIRIVNPDPEDCQNDSTSAGCVSRVDVSSKVEVVWADNSKSIVLPHHLYNVESEGEETDYTSVEGSSSGASSEEWEDDSDSWETVEEEHKEEQPPTPATPTTATSPDGPKLLTPASGDAPGALAASTPDQSLASATSPSGAGATEDGGGKPPGKEGTARGFRELKEALKILESLKNMTVEQLWTGSPTSPTAAEPSPAAGGGGAANTTTTNPTTTPSSTVPTTPASDAGTTTTTTTTTPTTTKPTKEKRFLDDIKKLQENLKKTLDVVAIVEEERKEGTGTTTEEDRSSSTATAAAAASTTNPTAVAAIQPQAEPQTPVRSEWPSDTPVLCQQSGGKPGVTFTSAKGEVFSVLDEAPESHSFKIMEFQPAEAKRFFSTVRKEMALLATSLPDGIMVKTFEDRMDLFAALIKGPTRTPYEDGLFLFDIQLPNIYPAVPPLFRYLSQCSGRLNPNLYDNGKVCVSLLGTWIGRGTERWTSKSSLLQVLISIQGLILVNEPYYNEAGFDSDRGLQEGYENSRCYNEMSLIKMVQSMTTLLQHPVQVFQQEIRQHFAACGWRLVHRLEFWLELDGAVVERGGSSSSSGGGKGVSGGGGGGIREALEEIPQALAQSSPNKPEELKEDEEEVLDDSGLSPSTTTVEAPGVGVGGSSGSSSTLQQDLSQSSDCEGGSAMSSGGAGGAGGDASDSGLLGSSAVTTQGGCKGSSSSQESSSQSQPQLQQQQPPTVVRPKKRRKSYRSFLPERSGYPDIGFPLFPLSKGFVKSMCGVLLTYRAALVAAGIPEHPEEK